MGRWQTSVDEINLPWFGHGGQLSSGLRITARKWRWVRALEAIDGMLQAGIDTLVVHNAVRVVLSE